MKRNHSLCVIALVTALPTAGAAQDFSGALTLGYGSTNVSGISQDISTLTLDGRAKLDFGNGLRLGAAASVINGQMDGMTGDVTGRILGIQGSYRLANGLTFGVYVEDASLNVDGLATNPSATSMGLMGGYEANGLAVNAFLGKTTTDPALPSGIDVRDYGLSINYAASEKITLGGSAIRTTISGFGTNMDIEIIGVAGAYAINPEWSVFAGVSRASLDLANADVTTFGLGASYDLSSVLKVGSSVSLELARSDASLGGVGGDIDTIRIGLTIPFGGESAKVPLNSVADSIMNPRHSAISSAVLAAF